MSMRPLLLQLPGGSLAGRQLSLRYSISNSLYVANIHDTNCMFGYQKLCFTGAKMVWLCIPNFLFVSIKLMYCDIAFITVIM